MIQRILNAFKTHPIKTQFGFFFFAVAILAISAHFVFAQGMGGGGGGAGGGGGGNSGGGGIQLGICYPPGSQSGPVGSQCDVDNQCAPYSGSGATQLPVVCEGGSGVANSFGGCNANQQGTCTIQTICPFDPVPHECQSNVDCTEGIGGVCIPGDLVVPGCEPVNVCQYQSPYACTTGAPAGPSDLTLSLVNPTTINSDANTISTGDTHMMKLIYESQMGEVESAYNLLHPFGQAMILDAQAGALDGNFTIVNSSNQVQKLVMAVKNYDDCQDIWGLWSFSNVLSVPPISSGGPSCTGSIPSSFEMCAGDDNPSSNTPWTYSPGCTAAAKCEYTCPAGNILSGGQCIPIPVCTGSVPATYQACAGDDQNLTSSAAWSYAGSCTVGTMCEYTCPAGSVQSGGLCVPTEAAVPGNVFGYAWSSNIGWIKMNSCDDDDQDGIADNGCVSAWGVRVDSPSNTQKMNANIAPSGGGDIKGYAWSNNVGWIKFGDLSSFPVAAGNVSSNAVLGDYAVTDDWAPVSGWARAITGGLSLGWDGWISLSGTNFASNAASALNGTGGMTYHPSSARFMGYSWGDQVLGWIKWSGAEGGTEFKTTYAVPATFDYGLAAIPVGLVIKQGDTDTTVISRLLEDGNPELVSLSAQVTTAPPDIPTGEANALKYFKFAFVKKAIAAPVDLTLSFDDTTATFPESPCANDADCATVLSVQVDPDAPTGPYKITVTGTSENGVEREVVVDVLVDLANDPFELQVSCQITQPQPYLVNQQVEWTAKATSVAAFTADKVFQWTGSGGLVCDIGESCQTVYDSDGDGFKDTSKLKWTYNTTGKKNVNVSVDFKPATCTSLPDPATGEADPFINVVVQPKIDEF